MSSPLNSAVVAEAHGVRNIIYLVCHTHITKRDALDVREPPPGELHALVLVAVVQAIDVMTKLRARGVPGSGVGRNYRYA